MNSRFARGAAMLLSLWLALPSSFYANAQSTAQAGVIPDVLQALGFPALFEEGKVPLDSLSREGSLETILSGYCDVSLPEVITLAEKLEEDRWYLTGDHALRDKRSLLLRFDLKTRRLTLELTIDAGKAVWPDVLTPQLACTTPVFTGGIYKDAAPQEIENRLDNVTLTYAQVKPDDALAYEALLAQEGYEQREAEDKRTEYAKNLSFVRLGYRADEEMLDITVGRYLVYFVPLPPWPDKLPEQLRRTLPPVAPRPVVDAVASGYLAMVTDMTLVSLYRFVNSAQRHYGWAMPGDNATMAHQTIPVQLEFLAWNTDTHRLIILLEGDAAVP